jgi:hypothetical protein
MYSFSLRPVLTRGISLPVRALCTLSVLAAAVAAAQAGSAQRVRVATVAAAVAVEDSAKAGSTPPECLVALGSLSEQAVLVVLRKPLTRQTVTPVLRAGTAPSVIFCAQKGALQD